MTQVNSQSDISTSDNLFEDFVQDLGTSNSLITKSGWYDYSTDFKHGGSGFLPANPGLARGDKTWFRRHQYAKAVGLHTICSFINEITDGPRLGLDKTPYDRLVTYGATRKNVDPVWGSLFEEDRENQVYAKLKASQWAVFMQGTLVFHKGKSLAAKSRSNVVLTVTGTTAIPALGQVLANVPEMPDVFASAGRCIGFHASGSEPGAPMNSKILAFDKQEAGNRAMALQGLKTAVTSSYYCTLYDLPEDMLRAVSDKLTTYTPWSQVLKLMSAQEMTQLLIDIFGADLCYQAFKATPFEQLLPESIRNGSFQDAKRFAPAYEKPEAGPGITDEMIAQAAGAPQKAQEAPAAPTRPSVAQTMTQAAPPADHPLLAALRTMPAAAQASVIATQSPADQVILKAALGIQDAPQKTEPAADAPPVAEDTAAQLAKLQAMYAKK